MPAKLKGKTFYACTIQNKEVNRVRKKEKATAVGEINPIGLPDMFHILLHNQTIMNEKLNDLLKGQGRSYN